MITAWILYAVVVGALLGAGALALETLLRHHSLPSRWVWMVALLLSVTWPLGHWALENRPRETTPAALPTAPPAASQELTAIPFPAEAVTVEVPPESFLRLLDGPVLVAWGLATTLLLLFFALLLVRTRRLKGRWQEGSAGGRLVLFSDEWGPAVVGLLRPRIVLPRWCEDIDHGTLSLILDHELEHVRAGDLRLVILAGALPVLCPWHIPLWWQWARLRTAVEADCDLRVLRKNPGRTRPYVDLLLTVGGRSPRRRPLAAMLSEPYETLKRRIRIMTMPLSKKSWVRGGLLAGAGAILLAIACWAPGPTDGESEEALSPAEASSPQESLVEGENRVTPTFTPFSVRPAIRNREEVMEALNEAYPPLLEDAGIGGTVNVWAFIDEEGQPQRLGVNESSGHRALDEAALRLASLMEFTPALNRDQRRPVWISLPIEFTTEEGRETGAAPTTPERARSGRSRVTTSSEEGASRTDETGSIEGIVMDAATDQPLAFVQVFVPGTGRGTLTNQEGRFVITDVPTGRREVVARLIGFGESGRTADVSARDPAEVTLNLQATAIPFSKLVVTGVAGGGGR